jgi:hypothetical protein
MDGTTTTTSGAGDDQRADAPTGEQPQLLATAVGDQCANCGARLAGDQRYCVECGERRGKPRYSLSGAGTSSSPRSAGGGRRRLRMTANSTLIAGVATLLLAMGVGVLIGRTSAGSTARNSPEQVITVASGGGAASGTPTTASTPSSTPSGTASKSSSSKSAKVKSAKSAKASLSAKLPAKAKVIPPKLKSSVEKQGQSCTSATKGCTNGKFTGTFFGGG